MTDLTKDSPATKKCPFCSEVIHINAKNVNIFVKF